MGAQHLSGSGLWFLRGIEKWQVELSTNMPEIQVRCISCELNHGLNELQGSWSKRYSLSEPDCPHPKQCPWRRPLAHCCHMQPSFLDPNGPSAPSCSQTFAHVLCTLTEWPRSLNSTVRGSQPTGALGIQLLGRLGPASVQGEE